MAGMGVLPVGAGSSGLRRRVFPPKLRSFRLSSDRRSRKFDQRLTLRSFWLTDDHNSRNFGWVGGNGRM